MKEHKPIYVTRPCVPSFEEFSKVLKEIYDSRCLTNIGPYHKMLESELTNYLGVKYLSLFANGTLALITAIKLLNIKGEVITTPFSFVATAHALWWNGIKPVFVDIDPKTCNINADKIEPAITPETSAILPVHVYGNPCDFDKINLLAEKYKLKVIYDAAHAFGVKKNNETILNFGDLSVLSFHATKVFNTLEGGAIISHTREIKEKIDLLKNFGFADEITVVGLGINAKMNELQAAWGLLLLKELKANIEKRKYLSNIYKDLLKNVTGIRFIYIPDDVTYNYSYFPIIIEKEFPVSRDKVYEVLMEYNIFPRRYFFPLITEFPPYNKLLSTENNLVVAKDIASKILCLPLYPELEEKQVIKISKIISNVRN